MKKKIQKWLGIPSQEELNTMVERKTLAVIDRRLNKFRNKEKAIYGHVLKQLKELQSFIIKE